VDHVDKLYINRDRDKKNRIRDRTDLVNKDMCEVCWEKVHRVENAGCGARTDYQTFTSGRRHVIVSSTVWTDAISYCLHQRSTTSTAFGAIKALIF